MIAALLTALALGQATPAPARDTPPPPAREARGPAEERPEADRPVRPEPSAPRAEDPDAEVIRNLDLLLELELLEHADAFDAASRE